MSLNLKKEKKKKEDEVSLGIGMFQNDVIKILRLNPLYRKTEEIQRIIDFLIFFEVFRNFENLNELKEICKSAEYLYIEQGTFVFTQGDSPDYYYIVIKGEVAGSVKKIETTQTKFLDEVDIIFKLGYGKGFGELALLENVPRSASLFATKATHLMLVSRVNYIKAVQFYHQKQAIKNVEFLNEVRLFDKFEEEIKKKFSSFCYENTFQSKSVLLKQNDPITKIFFIKTGSISMFRTIDLETISPKIREKYKIEISKIKLPMKIFIGALGNNDNIGIHEISFKIRSKFDYIVSIPSRLIEMNMSDLLKQEFGKALLTLPVQISTFPDDDIFVQEFFERNKWQSFQHNYSQKVLCENKIEKNFKLRMDFVEKDLNHGKLKNQSQTCEKMKDKLRLINANIKEYMKRVKDRLPMMANAKNHVALYEIMNLKNKSSRKNFGLGINQIMNEDN